MKPVAYFLCALALILICISPWLILSYYEKLPESPYFQGILSLWHIPGWRTGGSSGAAFLQKRITQFEGQNPHVFIELRTLSAKEAAQALQSGEKPDIISYPYGTNTALEMSALPAVDTIFSDVPDTAYPYMCGGYCLLVNTDMLAQSGINIKSDWGIRPEALLEASTTGVGFDAEDGCTSLPALALHAYPEAQKPQISTWGEPSAPEAALSVDGVWENGFDAFCAGDAGLLIASHRQLFEAAEQYTQGEVPPFTAYAVGPYTDMVQMISVARQQEDDLRQEAAESFALFLLCDSAQKKLEALGVFPVKPGLDIYRQSDIYFAMYEQLSVGAVLPHEGTKETLDTLAKSAFGGNEHDLKRLRRLLGE